MVTEMITLKLEDVFLHKIDSAVRTDGYKTRTEFIRDALREKLEERQTRTALLQLARLKGASKKRISKKEYELIRMKSVSELK